jgi:hypothetical protein
MSFYSILPMLTTGAGMAVGGYFGGPMGATAGGAIGGAVGGAISGEDKKKQALAQQHRTAQAEAEAGRVSWARRGQNQVPKTQWATAADTEAPLTGGLGWGMQGASLGNQLGNAGAFKQGATTPDVKPGSMSRADTPTLYNAPMTSMNQNSTNLYGSSTPDWLQAKTGGIDSPFYTGPRYSSMR